MRTLYFDYNATTPVAPEVRESLLPFLDEHFGNPSSHHALGRVCHKALEDARTRLAEFLGADPSEIVFTAGGTESNNLALKGAAFRRAPQGGGHLVISAVEHPAIDAPARFLERLGFDLTVVGTDSQGRVDPAEVERVLRHDTFLVSVMHANNEIGTIEPVREIASICRKHGVLMHTDAAQSAGKIPVRVDDLGVDLLSLAGHKMYAPKGIGALYVRRGIDLEPLLHGAGHEGGLRAGTENVAFIVALGTAASLADRLLDETAARTASFRDRLYERLCEGVGAELSVNAAAAPRLPNTLSVNFPRTSGADILARAVELCASTGAACHAGAEALSATQAATGMDPDTARGMIRLSLGRYTSGDDVDRAADALIAAWDSLR